MMGMILYRDRTIPLIDLSTALELEDNKGYERRIVIITEFNSVVTGFLVDSVNRIHRLYWSDFVPMDSVLGNVAESITGSIHVDGSEVLVVDLEHILSVISPHLAINDLTSQNLDISEKCARENMRIYFAEDSKTIRKNVVRILKNACYKNIKVFDDGQQAYDNLIVLQGQTESKGSDVSAFPDVMITDIEMPQIDGLTLCKKIKEDERLKQIHVVIFSSLINRQMIKKCEAVGTDSYVTKPEMDRLVNILDKLCLDK
jgi:two-component system chemotaxis response regulator CheV